MASPIRPRRWRHDRRTLASLPRSAQGRADRRARDHGPARRHRAPRRRRLVPHRPARPGGAVGREVRRRAAVRARPRERRLGARDRLRGLERRGRRHGHRPSAGDVRAVPRVSRRRRRALREQPLPRHLGRRRLRGAAQDERAVGRQARPVAAPEGHRGAGRRGADRLPRRQEGRLDPASRHARGRHRRGRPRPHRHPVPEGDDAGRDHRRSTRPRRPARWPARSAPTRPSPSTASRSTRSSR